MVNLNAITHVEIALFKHGRHMMVYYNSTTRYVCIVTCLHFPVTTLMAQESLWPEREKEPQRILSKLCRKQQRQLLDNAAAYCDMGLLMLSVSR